jgi:hypothetical protein
VQVNHTLWTLHVDNNGIDAAGTKAVGEALKVRDEL